MGARAATAHVDAADRAATTRITVVPVRQPRPTRWWWPTRTPGTSVSGRGPWQLRGWDKWDFGRRGLVRAARPTVRHTPMPTM